MGRYLGNFSLRYYLLEACHIFYPLLSIEALVKHENNLKDSVILFTSFIAILIWL